MKLKMVFNPKIYYILYNKRIFMKSSSIKSVNYNKDTLTITFTNNKKYIYNQVPNEVAVGLAEAKSKGKYFHNNIKGKYYFQRKG